MASVARGVPALRAGILTNQQPRINIINRTLSDADGGIRMYENAPRGSVRRRVARIARQRGWIGEGGFGMVVPIVVVAFLAIIALWMTVAVAGLVFSLIPAAIIGFLTGWLASRLTGTRLGTGWTILAGVAGSWLGSALFGALLHVRVAGLFNPMHWIASILGAAIVIVFVRVVARPALPGTARPRLGRLY